MNASHQTTHFSDRVVELLRQKKLGPNELTEVVRMASSVVLIDLKCLAALMKRAGLTLSDKQVLWLMTDLSEERTTSISFECFIRFLARATPLPHLSSSAFLPVSSASFSKEPYVAAEPVQTRPDPLSGPETELSEQSDEELNRQVRDVEAVLVESSPKAEKRRKSYQEKRNNIRESIERERQERLQRSRGGSQQELDDLPEPEDQTSDLNLSFDTEQHLKEADAAFAAQKTRAAEHEEREHQTWARANDCPVNRGASGSPGNLDEEHNAKRRSKKERKRQDAKKKLEHRLKKLKEKEAREIAKFNKVYGDSPVNSPDFEQEKFEEKKEEKRETKKEEPKPRPEALPRLHLSSIIQSASHTTPGSARSTPSEDASVALPPSIANLDMSLDLDNISEGSVETPSLPSFHTQQAASPRGITPRDSQKQQRKFQPSPFPITEENLSELPEETILGSSGPPGPPAEEGSDGGSESEDTQNLPNSTLHTTVILHQDDDISDLLSEPSEPELEAKDDLDDFAKSDGPEHSVQSSPSSINTDALITPEVSPVMEQEEASPPPEDMWSEVDSTPAFQPPAATLRDSTDIRSLPAFATPSSETLSPTTRRRLNTPRRASDTHSLAHLQSSSMSFSPPPARTPESSQRSHFNRSARDAFTSQQERRPGLESRAPTATRSLESFIPLSQPPAYQYPQHPQMSLHIPYSPAASSLSYPISQTASQATTPTTPMLSEPQRPRSPPPRAHRANTDPNLTSSFTQPRSQILPSSSVLNQSLQQPDTKFTMSSLHPQHSHNPEYPPKESATNPPDQSRRTRGGSGAYFHLNPEPPSLATSFSRPSEPVSAQHCFSPPASSFFSQETPISLTIPQHHQSTQRPAVRHDPYYRDISRSRSPSPEPELSRVPIGHSARPSIITENPPEPKELFDNEPLSARSSSAPSIDPNLDLDLSCHISMLREHLERYRFG